MLAIWFWNTGRSFCGTMDWVDGFLTSNGSIVRFEDIDLLCGQNLLHHTFFKYLWNYKDTMWKSLSFPCSLWNPSNFYIANWNPGTFLRFIKTLMESQLDAAISCHWYLVSWSRLKSFMEFDFGAITSLLALQRNVWKVFCYEP